MRKIVVAVMSTISGLVLLFSYHTSTNSEATPEAGGDPGTDTGQSAVPSSDPTAGTGTAPAASASPTAEPSATTPATASSSGSYTGDPVETRWGTVQVEITVTDGTITAADAIDYPTGNPKDQRINALAIPTLNAEVLEAQSAQIDAVSGATVTSGGYVESLQSAIDAAHLQ
ncbi:MAG: FMN-binding protein [Propionicimonas sp.]|nr:FMN-binding protein [Propionicimonas sp.]